ncbi:MAG: hypothetical protein IKM66_02930 [Clostridia bacterium]|nr:hypothetical protein [Clostridia bacterium]
MKYWQMLKFKIIETIGNTRAELKLNKDGDANEYIINGVRYVVSTQYSKTETMTLKDRIKKYIGSDFAHLTTAEDINTINKECVCMTAGKED